MIHDRIVNEITPFFQYATNENPNKVISEWTDSNKKVSKHKAYGNCVACNTKRFTRAELNDLWVGTDSYFCKPCGDMVVKIVKKYDTGKPNEEYEVFNKVWNDFLFRSGNSKL